MNLKKKKNYNTKKIITTTGAARRCGVVALTVTYLASRTGTRSEVGFVLCPYSSWNSSGIVKGSPMRNGPSRSPTLNLRGSASGQTVKDTIQYNTIQYNTVYFRTQYN